MSIYYISISHEYGPTGRYPVTSNSVLFLFKKKLDRCHKMACPAGHRFCCVACLFARFCVRDCGCVFYALLKIIIQLLLCFPPTLFRFILVSYGKISFLHFFLTILVFSFSPYCFCCRASFLLSFRLVFSAGEYAVCVSTVVT